MKTRKSGQSAFTLVEIMIVVAIIGLLAAIAVPNFVRARSTSQTNACINNLRQIDGAKQEWALETRQSETAVPTHADLDVYLRRSATADYVACPSGGNTATFSTSYTLNSVTNAPVCNVLPTGPLAHALP